MRKRQITRGSELATCVTFPSNRDSSVESQRTPNDTQGGFGHAPTKKVGYRQNDSGSPDVLIRGRTAVTVESSLGQGLYACPANGPHPRAWPGSRRRAGLARDRLSVRSC